METIEVKSFVDYIRQCDDMDLFANVILFRGQSLKGNLLPSVARDAPEKDTTSKEKATLAQLRLLGASFLAGNETKDLDLLVLAQHFGLKTRLLDWTTNPLAALWFACAADAVGDVYVYSLDGDALLIEDVYEQDPFKTAKTRVFQPRNNNARVNAQHGWFSLHRYAKSNSRFVALEKNPEVTKYLTEFHISAKKRPTILRSLDRHGVSARTLYPDLGGLCQYLNWKRDET